MKKTIGIIAVLAMSFTLFACSSKPEESTEKPEIKKTEAAKTPEKEETASMPEFTSVDLAGNEVTNAVFGEADLTVVNFWGTFCGPCISEMPQLAAWDQELPENVQIVGVIVDAVKDSKEQELARQIVEKTGVQFPNILVTVDFNEILRNVVGVPTTFFVDGSGTLVGEPIVGANVNGYKQFVEEYINEQK